MMRLPDAADQVRNAPVRVLRAFFAGIGQLLLAADRFRAEEAERERSAEREHHDPFRAPDRQPTDGHDQDVRDQAIASGARAPASRATGDSQPAGQPRFRSLDSTGNVRVLTPAEAAEMLTPAAAAEMSAQEVTAAAGANASPQISQEDLPVPGYDGRSLPSLRSRLRSLDAAQLRVLVDYEKSNAGRADVVTMFERRIAKLEAAGSDAT